MLPALAAALARAGVGQVELFIKRGRARRVELGSAGERLSALAHEEGWAVRAGGVRASFFAAGTGPAPDPDARWPEPTGRPLALPDPRPVPPWTAPADLDTPLCGENEALALIDGIARQLGRELPGARLVGGFLEDGTSEGEIVSSRGIEGRCRTRAASLRLEAAAGGCRAIVQLVERDVQRFRPPAVARRLADRLAIEQQGRPPAGTETGEVLLAPPVALRLLAGLLPLMVGSRAGERALAYCGADRRLASPAVTIVDDARLRDGVLAAPVDGEGLPAGRTVLVEEGRYVGPLLPWHEAPAGAWGSSRRPGWRDVPRPGPSHLYVAPDPRRKAADLIAGVGRGAYLLDGVGPGWFSLEEDRFALPVCGFTLRGGEPAAPLAGAWLAGPTGRLLRGVEAVARDLTFLPCGGMLGSPTLLVSGLALLPAPPRRG